MSAIDPDRVLLHAFATDGYVPWAELLLESLRCQHGEAIRVRLDGWNLSDEHVAALRDIYGNLELHSQTEPHGRVAEVLGVDRDTVLRWQREVEADRVTAENFKYKIYFSVNKRYRSMHDVVRDAKERGYHYLIHLDVDIYIRRPFDAFLEALRDHDVGVFVRKDAPHTKRVFGAILGFNLTGGIEAFLERWMAEIDAVPMAERWRGFGQSALGFAVEKARRDGLAIADLNELPDGPRYSRTFDRSAHFWLGSNSKRRGAAMATTRKRCWNDLKAGLPRIEPDLGSRGRLASLRAALLGPRNRPLGPGA